VTDAEAPNNIGYLLWRLAGRWRAAVDRAVAPLGLTHAQYSVLASLHGLSRSGARPSQRQLADFTGLEPVYVSKLVRALEQSGFLTRTVHAADPRAVELSLTQAGSAVVRKAVRTVQGLQEELTLPLGGRDSTEARRLAATLRKLLNHCDDIA
jgi:MarR family transcriptional regulator, organic hydroperoxide resistance regulator